MRRSLFAAIVAVALVLAMCMRPVPTRAIVPVFDAAAFEKMLEEVISTETIKNHTFATMISSYQTAQSLFYNGQLNFDVAWNLLTPMLGKIDTQVANDQKIAALITYLQTQFQTGYPGWNPSVNYDTVMQQLNANLQGELADIVQTNQQEMIADAQNAKSVDQLTRQNAKSKGVVDAMNTVGAELNAMEGTEVYIHHALSSMVNEMASYTAYEMQKDTQGGQQRTNLMLNSFFANLPTPAPPPSHSTPFPRVTSRPR